MKVSELMSSPAVTAAPATPVRDVGRLMDKYGVGAVVMTENGFPAGIVTDRDLALHVLVGGLNPESPVSGAMSSPVITVDVNDGAQEAYRTFRRCGVRRLPVLDEQQVIGVLTVDDMLMDVFRRMADLLAGPIAWSVLEELPGPPGQGAGPGIT
ncbi:MULTISPECIES: CBS domain-containing protein [unclassified Streptomyces]|uniref:CBS domain-containing protein n=1 Tax=unclassified Streptomyces TaxID=2593676 RepID=UPI00093BB3F4|nr:CBS domain-containing protein [Streptomyces sp. CB01580]OKJ39056.1 histidine kinase [Streptomyces sp. CB01580]